MFAVCLSKRGPATPEARARSLEEQPEEQAQEDLQELFHDEDQERWR